MSQAGAISTSALMRAASAARSDINRRSRASAMWPPMLEPMMICGPVVTRQNTASASPSHAPMVPSSKRPLDSPWPE